MNLIVFRHLFIQSYQICVKFAKTYHEYSLKQRPTERYIANQSLRLYQAEGTPLPVVYDTKSIFKAQDKANIINFEHALFLLLFKFKGVSGNIIFFF